jgi:hypothetical protein
MRRCDGPGHLRAVIAVSGEGSPARIAFMDDSSVVIHEALEAAADGRYER